MPTKTKEREQFDEAKRAALAKYKAIVRKAEEVYRGDMEAATKAYQKACQKRREQRSQGAQGAIPVGPS